MIISGGANGADTLAEMFADKFGCPILIIRPDWDAYGKRAGFLRNEEIVNEADVVLAFWDGESKGTKHTINLTKKAGKKLIIKEV